MGSCCGRWVEYVDPGRYDVVDAWPPHEATIGMAVTISEDVVEIVNVTNDGELRIQYEVVDTFFTYDP